MQSNSDRNRRYVARSQVPRPAREELGIPSARYDAEARVFQPAEMIRIAPGHSSARYLGADETEYSHYGERSFKPRENRHIHGMRGNEAVSFINRALILSTAGDFPRRAGLTHCPEGSRDTKCPTLAYQVDV